MKVTPKPRKAVFPSGLSPEVLDRIEMWGAPEELQMEYIEPTPEELKATQEFIRKHLKQTQEA